MEAFSCIFNETQIQKRGAICVLIIPALFRILLSQSSFPKNWLNFFKTFPKLELHCHLLGTTSKETFEELVAESGADVSQEEINNFYTRGDKPVGVLRIFRCLESKVLSKPSFLTRITLKHIQRVASQGVKYIEFYWNWTGLKHFMTYDEARQAINEGIRQGMQRYGVTARSIPSIDREDTPEAAVELD